MHWGSAKIFLCPLSCWQVLCLVMAQDHKQQSITLVWAKDTDHLFWPDPKLPGAEDDTGDFWNSLVSVRGNKKGQKARRWGDYTVCIIRCHTETSQHETLGSSGIESNIVICKSFISLGKLTSHLYGKQHTLFPQKSCFLKIFVCDHTHCVS